MKSWASIAFVSLLTLGLSAQFGCSSSKSSSQASVSSRAYAGAGSDWRWTLRSDGTFTGEELDHSVVISGTYTTTATGFIRAVVTSSTGTGAPAVGTVLAGKEIPGLTLLWAPIVASESQIVGTVQGGVCPTADMDLNFLVVQVNNMADLTIDGSYAGSQREFFGTFHWDVAQGKGTVPSRYFLANNYEHMAPPNSPLIEGSCSGGIITTNVMNAYLAPAAAVVKVTEVVSPSYDESLIAIPTQAIGSLAALNGSYSGFTYNEDDSPAVTRVTATVNNGTLTVTEVDSDDLVTAVNGGVTGTATLTDADSPSDGFVKGNINGSPMICAAATNVVSSGKTVLYCLGQNPNNPTRPFMFVVSSI